MYLKRIERVAKTDAHGVHGSKIIFTPRIPDERCSCLLSSHSAAKYILGPNPSSLSRPHPCLLPLPPFSRWRRGFQARPGTAPRRGRPQARPQPGAAAPRVAAATVASTLSVVSLVLMFFHLPTIAIYYSLSCNFSGSLATKLIMVLWQGIIASVLCS